MLNATLFHCFTFYFYFLRLRKFAALFLKLLSSFVVTSRLGANIKFYNRPIRFRKPEALWGPFDRKKGREGRRGEEAHFLRHETCVSLLSPSLPGRSDPARRTALFIIFTQEPLKVMPGNKRGLKERGPDANKRSERARKLVHVHARTRVRVYTRTTKAHGVLRLFDGPHLTPTNDKPGTVCA